MTTPRNQGCKVPPPGWWCSREPGHEGPCAARPTPDNIPEVQAAMHRLAEELTVSSGSHFEHGAVRDDVQLVLASLGQKRLWEPTITVNNTPQQLLAHAKRVLGANSTTSAIGRLATAILDTIPETPAMTDIEHAVDQIRLAIENEGVNPYYHRRIMGKHRREWPTLWRAIDGLLELHERGFRNRADPAVTT